MKYLGMTFGRLTVIGKGRPNLKHCFLQVRCECGTEKEVRLDHLRSGDTTSCGCYRNEQVSAALKGKGRGGVRMPEQNAYFSAKGRCNNPKNRMFPQYGGRGIRFCFDSFSDFFSALGPRPSSDYSLDRIDVNGNYELGNVRWATQQEQDRNRQNSFLITHNNQTKHVADWARETGLKPSTIRARILKHAWPIERALTTPANGGAR